MPTIVECPACGRKLNLPDQLLGQQVRCPTCSETFRGEGAPVQPPPLPAPAAVADAPPPLPPPPRPTPAAPAPPAQACPYCREKLPGPSPHCPYCGERLAGNAPGPQSPPWDDPRVLRRDWEPHRGTLVLVLGIISIVFLPFCFLVSLPPGLIAWTLGAGDLRKMKQNEMDPLGYSSTQAGWICGMIGTLLALFATAFCGFFIVLGAVSP